MAASALLVLCYTDFPGVAFRSAAYLEDSVLNIRIVVGPIPDIFLHPKILGEPKIVLRIFGAVERSNAVIQTC